MNILLINHYAGAPKYGMEFRPYYMSREWVKAGHKVLILGGTFSHLRKRQPERSGSENLDGVLYHWIKTLEYKGNGLKRVLSMLQFVSKLWMNSKSYLDGFVPDAVIASSTYPFDIYPARKIARRYNAKLVYEVHDLWPLSPMLIGGYSKYHPFIWLLQQAENYAYGHCDKVVSMLDKALPHMQRHGLDSKRFACVPNGYLAEEWRDVEKLALPSEHSALFQQIKKEGRMVVGYVGGHTASTAMHVFIEAADQLRGNKRLAFVLVGQGTQKEDLIKLSHAKELANVYFLPAVDKQLIPKVIENFDICYMGGVHSELHRYGTSFNKMTDYMLSSKPIVMSVDEPESVVERCGCGIQVEAENVEKVTRAIRQLSQMGVEERSTMGRRGYDYAVANLEYSTLAARFIKALTS